MLWYLRIDNGRKETDKLGYQMASKIITKMCTEKIVPEDWKNIHVVSKWKMCPTNTYPLLLQNPS